MQTMPENAAASLIRAQMPHILPPDAEGYVRYADRMGGAGSIHLTWVCDCVSEFVPYGRVIGGAVLKAIAELPAGLPNLKRCLTFAALQCPSSKVQRGGVVNWVSGLALISAR